MGATVTVAVVNGETVTDALADLVLSAALVAVMVSVAVEDTLGAVYRPAAEMVPTLVLPPTTPFTDHVAAVFVLPLTIAVNCCVFPDCKLEVAGETDTLTAMAVGLAPEPVSGTPRELVLVLTFKVPVAVPTDMGENVIFNCMVCDGASFVFEDQPERLNVVDPEILTEFTQIEEVPVLLIVTVCCLLEPVVTVPNATEAGLTLLDRLHPMAEQAENSNVIKTMGYRRYRLEFIR